MDRLEFMKLFASLPFIGFIATKLTPQKSYQAAILTFSDGSASTYCDKSLTIDGKTYSLHDFKVGDRRPFDFMQYVESERQWVTISDIEYFETYQEALDIFRLRYENKRIKFPKGDPIILDELTMEIKREPLNDWFSGGGWETPHGNK